MSAQTTLGDNQVTFREIVAGDGAVLSVLWAALIDEEVPDATPDVESWAEMTNLMAEASCLIGVVATANDGEPVGFIDGVVTYEPQFSEIHVIGRSFYVLPSFRGYGLGKYLAMYGIKQARDYGAVRCVTHSTPGRSLYAKLSGGVEMTEYQTLWVGRVL